MQGKDPGLALPLAWARPRGPDPVTSLAEKPEEQIVELARTGDRAAWDVLIARHDHRVVLSLLARGVRLHRARELAQQAWTRLYAQQRAGRLDRLELPGLAIRQAGFLALEDARSRPPEPASLETATELASMIDPAASIEERLIRRDELRRAQAELERCPPGARRVFAFIHANPGMRHADAARELGLSVQRVRQILCEVRARLRAAIETESPDD
jgi:DNA-directed RNA polymerase specialized sigma24 family protein